MTRFAAPALLATLFCVVGFSQPPGDAETVKVGILHSLTGTMAESEQPMVHAEMLAIQEINDAGGVLGKRIDAIARDCESMFTTTFPEMAKKLLLDDKVAVVFGCHTSVSRKNVLPVFEENKGLLFYPVAYEGNECSKNVIYTGATPSQQILPAIEWLTSVAGGSKKKFYLIGTDFVYPRTVNLIVGKALQKKELQVAAERYVPFGHRDFKALVEDIKEKNPDVIFSTVNSYFDGAVHFFDELDAQGVKTPVVSASIDEQDLGGLKPAKVQGHLAIRTYFQSIDTPKNKRFVEMYRAKFGKDQVVNDSMANAYEAVHLWKLAAEKAKSFDVDKLRAAISQVEFDGPSGKVKISPKTLHADRSLLVGKIRKDGQFEIVYRTAPIEADPYPEIAFKGWNCDWTKGGATRKR
jgi:urea transport system substrate-binding protein